MANGPGFLRPANIIQPSSGVATVALTTSAQFVDVIPNVQTVVFGATANFAVAYGSTLAIFPAASTTAQSSAGSTSGACEINPTVRNLQSTQVTTGLAIVGTTAGGFVTISQYSRGG